MKIFWGVLFVTAGVLTLLAAYYDKLGLVGWGSEAALKRKRLLTRGRLFVAGPLLIVVGVVVLLDPLAG